jgi:DNA-binding beta-propeller fold protein YncE
MKTKLQYSFIPNPNPLRVDNSHASLSLLITNSSNEPILLKGVSIQIPVGNGKEALTNFPGQLISNPPNEFKMAPRKAAKNSLTLVMIPKSGNHYSFPAKDSVVLKLTNIAISHIGVAMLTITEGTEGSPSFQINISKFPADWESINFTALPISLTNSGEVSLSWNGPNLNTAVYSISYLDAQTQKTITIPSFNQKPLKSEGTYPSTNDPSLIIDTTTTFNLTVKANISGQHYKTVVQQTVTVGEIPSIIDFKGEIDGSGINRKLTLAWKNSDNTDHIIASWRNYPLNGNSQSQPLPIPFKESYMIKAIANNGIKSNPSYVNLNWKLIKSFDIQLGQCEVAITPGADFAFVSNYGLYNGIQNIYGNTVTVLDLYNLKIVKTIEVGTNPKSIVCTQDGIYILVASQGIYFHISVIEISTLSIIHTIPIGASLGFDDWGTGIIKLTSDGKSALVLFQPLGTVSIINLKTFKIQHTVQLLFQADRDVSGMVIAPSDNFAFATTTYKDKTIISRIDLNNLSSTPVTIELTKWMASMTFAFSNDDKNLLISLFGLQKVVIIDIDSFKIANTINFSNGIPGGNITMTPNGKYALLVSPNYDFVWAIDIETPSEPPKQIRVGSKPSMIAIAPNETYAVVLNYGGGTMSKISLESLEVIEPSINVGPNPTNIVFTRHPDSTQSEIETSSLNSRLNYALVTNTSDSKSLKSKISILALDIE